MCQHSVTSIPNRLSFKFMPYDILLNTLGDQNHRLTKFTESKALEFDFLKVMTV